MSVQSIDFKDVHSIEYKEGAEATQTVKELVFNDAKAWTPRLRVFSTTAERYLKNITLQLWKDGVNTDETFQIDASYNVTYSGTTADWTTIVDSGTVFDVVKLADSTLLSNEIQADDEVAVLRHIVNLDPIPRCSMGFYALDVDNSGSITSDDAVAISRHAVQLGTVDTFSVVRVPPHTGDIYLIQKGSKGVYDLFTWDWSVRGGVPKSFFPTAVYQYTPLNTYSPITDNADYVWMVTWGDLIPSIGTDQRQLTIKWEGVEITVEVGTQSDITNLTAFYDAASGYTYVRGDHKYWNEACDEFYDQICWEWDLYELTRYSGDC